MPLRIACPVGEPGDLIGDLGPPRGFADRPRGVMLGQQALGQRGRVVVAAGDRHGPLGQRRGPRPVPGDRVLQLAGQRRGDARLHCGVAAGQGRPGAVQRVDELGARHGEAGAELVETERHGRDEGPVARVGGPGPGQVEPVAGRARVAGP